MGPEALAQVLRPLANMFPPTAHPDLLVGLGAPDDAAVYRLNPEQAIIETATELTRKERERKVRVANRIMGLLRLRGRESRAVMGAGPDGREAGRGYIPGNPPPRPRWCSPVSPRCPSHPRWRNSWPMPR